MLHRFHLRTARGHVALAMTMLAALALPSCGGNTDAPPTAVPDTGSDAEASPTETGPIDAFAGPDAAEPRDATVPDSLPGPSGDGATAEAGDGGPPRDAPSDAEEDPDAHAPVFVDVVVRSDLGGEGSVWSSPSGILCPSRCSMQVPYGRPVTLEAVVAPGSELVAWGGACAGTITDCTLFPRADATVTVTFRHKPNVMFVTSTRYAGDIGGLAGADQACNERAAAAGLFGRYVAWLSTTAAPAASRLKGARGWVRTDGKPFADGAADLMWPARGAPNFHPPSLDEFGREGGDMFVWTATGTDDALPELATGACLNSTAQYMGPRTAVVGNRFGGAVFWSNSTEADCTTMHPIYCFGVDAQVPVRPVAVRSRTAFLMNWQPRDGLRGADAQCNVEARKAGLSGDYLAMLATASVDMASRFNRLGWPWARPDGVLLAATREAFRTGPVWDTTLDQRADGTVDLRPSLAGAPNATTLGTAARTCENWEAWGPAPGWSGTGTAISTHEVTHPRAPASDCGVANPDAGVQHNTVCLEQ